MFDTFGDENMVINTDLAVRYATEAVYETIEVAGEPVVQVSHYLVRRVATMQYSFVGMTREAARACAAAKVAKYTRDYKTEGGSGFPQLMADIVSRHVGGHMYQVDININESEVAATFDIPVVPAALFPARDYDGISESPTLSIAPDVRSAPYREFYISVHTNIENFNISQMIVQGSTSTGVWQRLGNGAGPYSFPAEGVVMNVRAMYGEVISNEFGISREG